MIIYAQHWLGLGREAFAVISDLSSTKTFRIEALEEKSFKKCKYPV